MAPCMAVDDIARENQYLEDEGPIQDETLILTCRKLT